METRQLASIRDDPSVQNDEQRRVERLEPAGGELFEQSPQLVGRLERHPEHIGRAFPSTSAADGSSASRPRSSAASKQSANAPARSSNSSKSTVSASSVLMINRSAPSKKRAASNASKTLVPSGRSATMVIGK